MDVHERRTPVRAASASEAAMKPFLYEGFVNFGDGRIALPL
jgi:hypothetical protein